MMQLSLALLEYFLFKPTSHHKKPKLHREFLWKEMQVYYVTDNHSRMPS